MDITFKCTYCKQKFISDYDKDKYLYIHCPVCNKTIDIRKCNVDNKQYKPPVVSTMDTLKSIFCQLLERISWWKD